MNTKFAESFKQAINDAEEYNLQVLREQKKFPFFSHQESGVDYLMEHKRCILGDEMGLGKTLQSLASVDKRDETGNMHVLIIATKGAKSVWRDEIKKWLNEDAQMVNTTDGILSYSYALAHPEKRFIICNHEQVRNAYKMIMKFPYNMIIIDEAHKLRNKETAVRKAVKKVLQHFDYIPCIMVTGTPLVNSPTDLWSLLNMLYDGIFHSETEFLNRHFTRYGIGNSAKNFRHKSVTGFKDYMNQFMIRRERKDVMDLPPVQKITTPITLEGPQWEYYKQCRDEWLMEFGDQEVVLITCLLAQITRLKQICLSHHLAVPEKESCEGAKTEALVEMLEEWNGKVVIASQFKKYLKPLKKRLELEGHRVGIITGDTTEVERDVRIKAFQEGDEMNLMLITTKAGGESITLTRANRFEFMDVEWTPAAMDQAFSRIYRIGQDSEKVVKGYMRAEGTIEQYIEEIVGQKRMLFNDSIPLSMVRRMMLGGS